MNNMNVLSKGGKRQRLRDILSQYCKTLSIAISYIAFFSSFSNANDFPQSKTLSTSSVLSNKIKFSMYLFHLSNFLLCFSLPHKTTALCSVKSIDFIILTPQNFEFVFATFIKNWCNKLFILGVYESIRYRHTKSCNCALLRFFPPSLVLSVSGQ